MEKHSNVIDITDRLKNLASKKAVDFIKSGMVVGLGSGSTAEYAIKEIAKRINRGKLSSILGIPSSTKTERLAEELGLNIVSFKEMIEIDVTIDGADEVDSNMNLIKGGGGALLREKVLAQNSKRNVIVVHEYKISDQLGTKWPVPIEVLPFALQTEKRYIENLGAQVQLRTIEDGTAFLTDQNNFILDSNFGEITDPENLAIKLQYRAGIIEHGLFINTSDDIIVGCSDGIKHIKKK